MFRPVLKPGHGLPLEIDRKCIACGDTAISKSTYPHGSLVVNTTNLYMQCVNRFCRNRHIRAPIECFLKHRRWSLQQMRMGVQVEEGLILKEREIPLGRGKSVTVTEPDFNNPRYDPIVDEGPYENCGGHLEFEEGTGGRSTWLRCISCQARWHAFILVSRGLIVKGLDAYTHFNEFRWEVDKVTGQALRVVPTPFAPARNIKGIQKSVAMIIDECVWNEHHVREVYGL